MTDYPIPRLIERANNLGWMAVSPDDYKYRIGVVGATRAEAEAAFIEAVDRWEAIGEADE